MHRAAGVGRDYRRIFQPEIASLPLDLRSTDRISRDFGMTLLWSWTRGSTCVGRIHCLQFEDDKQTGARDSKIMQKIAPMPSDRPCLDPYGRQQADIHQRAPRAYAIDVTHAGGMNHA